jgi:ligand-binding SRPBCC domain-containing protein
VPVFVSSVVIDAPVAEVFRFHEREDAFTLLTPAFPPVRLISKSTPGIGVGTRLELRAGIFRWVALHTAYEKNKLFVDEQISGPFAKWVHRHEFEAVNAKTRLTDRIEYELPGGRLVNKLFGWAVGPGLSSMFAHRHRVTREFCETGSPH